jgi:hypothetical protein
MAYTTLATSISPALIIYLLDVSASMTNPLGRQSRLDVVMDALYIAIQRMVFLSTKGEFVSPRYHIAMYAYSEEVYDLLGGIKTIEEIAQIGTPELDTMNRTFTAKAFLAAEMLLQQNLSNYMDCPAPLVCHLTDGEYNGDDPEGVAQRIMGLANHDGKVLIENIFITDNLLSSKVSDIETWPGITPSTKFRNRYGEKLRAMSSPIPSGYRAVMYDNGYQLAEDALMMLPGSSKDLVQMGFVMSAATPISSDNLEFFD